MSDADQREDGGTSSNGRFKTLPEPIAVEDMSTSQSVDPPPHLPDSDYDRQERFLREAGG